MNTLIRICRKDDLPGLQRLYQQLQPADTTTLEEIMCSFAVMTAHPGCEVYVAETDGQVTGSFTLYILPNMTRNGRPAAILENIVVDEPRRGHGIGRAMLEYARAQAQARNCYKLSLTSNAVRAEAHEFYRRCGMTQHGLSFRYVLEEARNMLSLLPITDYHLLRPLATNRHLALVIDAMIAHPIPAVAWVDDPVAPRAALVWDQAYNYYFLGSPASRACLGKVLNDTVLAQARAAGRDIGIFHYAPDAWEPLLPEMLPGVPMKQLARHFYAFEASSVSDAPLPSGYRLQPIDAELLADERVEHRDGLLAELRLMWTRPEDFLEAGFGWCILHESSIACWCTAEYLSEGKCGIGIETREEHRRKGLATAAATAVVRESLSRGLAPHWDCWATNLPSCRVAERVGLIRRDVYAILLGQFS